MQRAREAALTRQAERLCAADKAVNDAVLERLGISPENSALPTPRPPTSLPLLRGGPKSSCRRRRLTPLLDVPPVNMEDVNKSQSPDGLDDDFRDESAMTKVEAVERVGHFLPILVPAPQPPVAPKRTRAVAPEKTPVKAPTPVMPLAPAPPTVPQSQKRGTRAGTFLRTAKADSGKFFFYTHPEYL